MACPGKESERLLEAAPVRALSPPRDNRPWPQALRQAQRAKCTALRAGSSFGTLSLSKGIPSLRPLR